MALRLARRKNPMHYTEITAVKGVRNDVSAERFGLGDLLYARNIDIDESGRAQRRAGTSTVFTGAAHSAWSDGDQGFFVQGGVLKRFLADGAISALTTITGAKVAYTAINGTAFWTDGISAGSVIGGVNFPWGITPPAAICPQPVAGHMATGNYLCTMTFVGADGKESGAPHSSLVKTTGGLSFNDLPVCADSRVTRKNIYISAVNGDLPFLSATVPNATTDLVITELGAQSVPVRTQFLGPAPAGQVLGYYNGRAYAASGPFLFYSQPYEHELFDLRSGFITFDSDIQTLAAVSDGIFVGTLKRTVFLAGTDPEVFVLRPVAPVGTVSGTVISTSGDVLAPGDDSDAGVATGTVVFWMSKLGPALGLDGGIVKDLTARRFTPPAASHGAALLKRRSATPQYVVSLFN